MGRSPRQLARGEKSSGISQGRQGGVSASSSLDGSNGNVSRLENGASP